MSLLISIALIGGSVLLWLHMQTVRELALSAARRHCREMGVQFLDGTVVLSGVRLRRNYSGSVALAQRFQFEFTVHGDRRYRGETVFLGKRQVSMQLEPHAI